ncbi:hypothetical protein [Sandaracinus amylolyticus]|uniref:hypothetical protein n=1 Tax=Sandaracinus amylolyticus TaxID=927083 RepID=UPI001F439010|nr:hypothetical protein [Sandaracinus amylolyticus]
MSSTHTADVVSRVQQLEVAFGERIEVDGETLTLDGLTLADEEGQSFGVRLSRDDGTSIDVWSPGYARLGEWVWRLESVDEDRARVSRVHAPLTPRALVWGERIELGCADVLEGDDGWRFHARSVRGTGAVWLLEMIGERGDERIEQVIDVQPEHAHEQMLDADHHVLAWTTPTLDAHGCARTRVELANPHMQILDAGDGSDITLRVRGRARVGDVLIGYRGWGEMIESDGEGRGLVQIEIERGGEVIASSLCVVGDDCTLGEWVVRVVSAGPSEARMSVRRAE